MLGFSEPLAILASGVVADRIFEPAMRSESQLASVFGGLVGIGEGAGMALLLLISGLLVALVGLVAYFVPAVRHVETQLPDYDQAVAANATS
jgi:hypothetical protein